jgi:hypothetical protein
VGRCPRALPVQPLCRNARQTGKRGGATRVKRSLAALAIGVALVGDAGSQDLTVKPQAQPAAIELPATAAKVPFGVGEKLEYQISAGPMRGKASMEITSLDTIRGHTTYKAVFNVRGGIPLFRVNDVFESWIDVNTLSLIKHHRDQDDGPYERTRIYDFYPEKGIYIENGRDTSKTVDRPQEEASILYFIRTLNFPVGLDTSLNNYFIPDRNPIRLRVVGRERIKVPAGEFDAIVIHPIVKARGLLSENSDPRVWLSDDSRHIVLQMKTRLPGLPVGSLNLYLKSYQPAPPTPSSSKH